MHSRSLGLAARVHPERPALVAGGRRLGFRELDERVARLAATLAGEGFKPGERLALHLPNGPDTLELLLACARLGVIAVPLNTRLAAVELDHILADARPRGLIRHSSLPAPGVAVAWQRVLDQRPLELVGGAAPAPLEDPDAILALIYTSGTTGQPKGVIITHANMLANVQHLASWLPFAAGDVYLHAAPIFHILDFPALFAAPATGACQATLAQFGARAFAEAVARERVSHTILVPTMINMLVQSPELGQHDLSSLATMAYGGSPMARELILRTRALFPRVKLVQGYGLSESGFLTALLDEEHTEGRLASCGRPPPGVDLRIVDESGRELAVGQHGELVARGPNVMRGYWNNPDETARSFRDGFFRTGDIGYRDAEGFFFILDRLKDMIVTGGENVYSGEVEAVLYAHPAVREAAVLGIPDSKWGELVMACVVRKPGATVGADELVAHCRQSLANYKVPRRIEFSDADLPKSGTGKILKRVLRERFWAGQERAVS